jgi:serine/threonine protein kinase
MAKGPHVFHKFEMIEKLGEGGMGEVWKARDAGLDRFVALKFLSSSVLSNPTALPRFKQEAIAASKLDHPNLCTIYEIGEAEGKTYIAMAFYEGQVLSELLQPGKPPLGLDEIRGYARQMADGLAKAHASGIVHRDIKPANIIITKDRVVKILDFGLAKNLRMADALTSPDTRLGTLFYMAPEQIEGGEVGPQADIWSLGAVLYEMLTQHRAFDGVYEAAVLYSIMNDDPRPLRECRPDAPENLAQVVRKALKKRPAERYPSMKDLIADLDATAQTPQRNVPQAEPRAAVAADSPGARGESRVIRRGSSDRGEASERISCHVLFMDIVKFSVRSLEEKDRITRKLQQVVQATGEFRRWEPVENSLLMKDTGDGLLLVFFHDPLSPIRCAVEIAEALKGDKELTLRIGIHGGLALIRSNILGQDDLAGAAVDRAQRVMDCGDAGHILLSETAAENALQTDQFRNHLQYLGNCRVKHGESIRIFNLVGEKWGSLRCPKKLYRGKLEMAGIAVGLLGPLLALAPWLRPAFQPFAILSAIPIWPMLVLGILLLGVSGIWILSASRQWRLFLRSRRLSPPYAIRAAAPWVLSACLTFFVLVDPCKMNPEGAGCTSVAQTAPQVLSYWMQIRRLGDRTLKEPQLYIDAAQRVLFPSGSHLSLFVEASEEGYLYVINQAAHDVGGLPGYALVFPRPGINAGNSKIPGGTALEVAPFEFDNQQGKERLFLLLAKAPLETLESLHPDEQLRLANIEEVQAVRTFMQTHAGEPPQMEILKDKVQVKKIGDILLYQLEFSTL